MKELLHNYRTVLDEPRVRTVLLAAALSVLGDGAAVVALVLRVHASGAGPWAVALLLLASALPVVLTMGLAGNLADHVPPRRVLLTTALVQSAAAVGLAAVDGLAVTLGLVLVLQTGFALGGPSWAAVLPTLAPSGRAGQVVALQHALRAVAGPLGAGAGGLLVAWRSPSAVLVLDAATFLALAGAALTLPRGLAAPAADRGVGRGSRWPRWRESLLPRAGVRALRADPVLGVIVLALLPVIVALEAVNVVEVFLVRDILGAGPVAFGLADAVAGAAAVLGALLSGAVTRRSTRVRALLGALVLVGLTQVGQGLAPGYAVYLVLGSAVGAALGGVNALVMALLLDEVAAERRGSVVALVGGLARAASGLALLLGGLVGSIGGPRTAFVAAGGLGLLVALAAVLAVRRVHRSVDAGSTARASRPLPVAGTLEA